MSGRFISANGAVITAASATGYITVADATLFFLNAICTVSAAGVDGAAVKITEVIVATNQLGLRFWPPVGFTNLGQSAIAGYNGGRIDMHAQFLQEADASSSGTNSGDVTLTAVGSTPNANGASLLVQALTLQPASASFPGILTTGAQTIAGAKTFSSVVNSSVASGSDSFKLLDGGRLNLSTADASSYFSRTAANTITTPALFIVTNTGGIEVNTGTGNSNLLKNQNVNFTGLVQTDTGQSITIYSNSFPSFKVGVGNAGISSPYPITGATIVSTGSITAAGTFQSNSATGDLYFASTAATAGIITTNVSAANAGATRTTAMLKIYPQNALDATDWLLSIGTAANAASVFNVDYSGNVAARTGLFTLNSTSEAGLSITNTNAAGFSGILYNDTAGTLKVFTGFSTSGTDEFRFNNVAASGHINFMIASVTKLAILNTGDTAAAGKILTTGGLGVGNSAAATVPGTVTRKMEVFDAAGASLGFIAIYDAIV